MRFEQILTFLQLYLIFCKTVNFFSLPFFIGEGFVFYSVNCDLSEDLKCFCTAHN